MTAPFHYYQSSLYLSGRSKYSKKNYDVCGGGFHVSWSCWQLLSAAGGVHSWALEERPNLQTLPWTEVKCVCHAVDFL